MRKNWRRILSLLLCAAMVMTMNTQAFAESLAGSTSEDAAAEERSTSSGVTEAASESDTENISAEEKAEDEASEETVPEDVSADAAAADDSDIEAAGATDTTWQDSFSYTLEGTNIRCTRCKDNVTSAVIYATATISGQTYNTVLDVGAFHQDTSIKSVSVYGGVKPSSTDCTELFNGCTALESVDLSGFDMTNVTSLYLMFCDCSALKSVDFSNCKMPGGTCAMDCMFSRCTKLTYADLGTASINYMENMFLNCTSIRTIDLSGINASKVFYSNTHGDEFTGCSSLEILRAPKSLFVDVYLPYAMYDSTGKQCTQIPKNVSYSTSFYRDKIQYTVSFNDTNGKLISENKVYAGGTVTAPKLNNKTGYYYGWYTDSTCTKSFDFSREITENLVLYAKEIPITYSVSFDANGGSGAMSKQDMKYDVTAALSANKFKRTGYTFAGWNTAKGGNGKLYADKASVTNLSDTDGATVTLYAQWTVNRYSIAFDANDGTGTMTKITDKAYYDEIQLTANAFSRTGYTFVSWNTAEDGTGTSYSNGMQVSRLTAENNATVTLYAQWKANRCRISFDANGGSGIMADQEVTYGNSDVLSANTFTKTGYIFAGWNTAADGTGLNFSDKQNADDLVSGEGVTVTLYAQWTLDHYSISFNANGGSGTMPNQDIKYDVTAALSANTFTKTGYIFTGWNTAADGKGEGYTDRQEVSNLSDKKTAAVTLYAQWQLLADWLNDYTFTVDETAQTITCTRYNNTTSTNAVVPALTVVNGKEYKTVLSGNVFMGCGALKSISIEEGVKTGSSCFNMFDGCRGLTSLDLKGLDTSAAENMSYMFNACIYITSLDLSSFNTAKVTDMSRMFNSCHSLEEPDLHSFNTANVTDMSCMFYGCNGIKKLDLSSFDTSKVTDMSYMFNGLSTIGSILGAMDSLDLSNFNTAKVTDMSHMFDGVYIKVLNISGFDMSKVQNADKMLYTTSGHGKIGVIRTPQKMGSISVDLCGIVFCDKWGNEYTSIPAGMTHSIVIADEGNATNYGYCFDVSIYDSSRKLIATETVPRSDTVYMPDTYTALYTDKSCCTVYDTDTPVYSDMTLYVKGKDYKEPVIPVTFYTVTFNSDGGSAVSSVRVAAGDDITLPEDPSKSGSEFGGWFTRANGKGTQYTDGTAVTGDTTLYAYWFTSDRRTDISESIITAIKAQTYDGSEKRPALTVLDGSKKLTEGVDYEVSFTNNIDAGAATATVNGIGDYKGTKSMIFAINKKPFNSRDFVVNTTDMKLTVSGAKSPVTVYDRTLNDYLIDGFDYNVTYEDADKAGTAKVTVTAAYEGSYTGKLSRTYRIFDTADSVIAAVSIYTVSADYNGKAQKPKVISVKDADGTDVDEAHYSVKYKNNKNAGLASVIVTGRRGYKGSVTVYFTINPIPVAGLTGLSVNRISDRTFSGSPIKPKPTVKYTNEKGKTVTLSSKYYNVIYSDNVEAGTAHILVTGRGNYGGTASGTFEITQRALTKGVKVKGFKSAVKLGSGAATQSNLTLVCGKYELTEGIDYTVRYENNTAAGKAKVIIEAADDSSFKGSITKSFRVK